MWKKLTPSEIEQKTREKNTPSRVPLPLGKIFGAAFLVGSVVVVEEILVHKYWYGNSGGKSFRLPWYNLTEHTTELFTISIICFLAVFCIGIIAHYFHWHDPENEVKTYICLKCQHTQVGPAMCEICRGRKLLDFWFVKWVEPQSKADNHPELIMSKKLPKSKKSK